MKTVLFKKALLAVALALPSVAFGSGMVPETSIVIVEEQDGEGAINVKNSDGWPAILVTTLESIPDDKADLLLVTPPTARVEAGKQQRVRFILKNKTPLKTERLQRVIFEGIPPKSKGKSEVKMTVRQNLPVLIRPAGLAKNDEPWKLLNWSLSGNELTVKNDSAYVVRMNPGVTTQPDNRSWVLPNSYILPGQTLKVKNDNSGTSSSIRIYPATTWGFATNHYDAPLVN